MNFKISFFLDFKIEANIHCGLRNSPVYNLNSELLLYLWLPSLLSLNNAYYTRKVLLHFLGAKLIYIYSRRVYILFAIVTRRRFSWYVKWTLRKFQSSNFNMGRDITKYVYPNTYGHTATRTDGHTDFATKYSLSLQWLKSPLHCIC